MLKKKYAVVYMMGGFGNQIFQLSFAKSLENLNLIVYIDTSNYLQKNKRFNTEAHNRELVIPIEEFGFKKVPFSLNLLFLLNNKIRKFSFKNYKFLPIGRYNDSNFKGKYKKFNQFVGYWQNLELLVNNKDFLLTKLTSYYKTFQFETPHKNGSTMLHVRRGDYVNMEEDLNIKYYDDAICKAKQDINNFYFDIFTDDKDWVLKNGTFKEARNIHSSSSSVEDTLKTFWTLFKYENFIISNSTFSLIPALLSENKNKKIYAPSPWFKNLNSTISYPNNWTTIKNI